MLINVCEDFLIYFRPFEVFDHELFDVHGLQFKIITILCN